LPSSVAACPDRNAAARRAHQPQRGDDVRLYRGTRRRRARDAHAGL